MFSKLALLITAAFAASALASPVSQCNSGPVQCCNSLQAPDSESVAKQLSLLNVVVSGLTGQVGVQCNLITVIGAVTGANCASFPVCCEKNFSNQLIGINCPPSTSELRSKKIVAGGGRDRAIIVGAINYSVETIAYPV